MSTSSTILGLVRQRYSEYKWLQLDLQTYLQLNLIRWPQPQVDLNTINLLLSLLLHSLPITSTIVNKRRQTITKTGVINKSIIIGQLGRFPGK
jgi:hypothetical protein